MKKLLFIAAAGLAIAGCARVDVVDPSVEVGQEVPIAFSTNKKNITKATQNLETTLHYNFGVWAQKYGGTGMSTQTVMENYLVGFGGTAVGYDHANATTWASAAGTDGDHTSPWFYEGLGNAEYSTSTAGFYTTSDTKYMSANANQYLRYWDLAYVNTNFYCYAPYMASGVTASLSADGSATITFDAANSIKDGYDKTLNSSYAKQDRSLSEFMYAGVKATNSDLKDIVVPFKHMGSQIFIRFYESIPGYKVEIVDLSADNGTLSTGATADQKKGIQATPASVSGTTYTKSSYYTSAGATVVFDADAVPTFTPSTTGSTTSTENLMFFAPSTAASDYSTANVPAGFGGNLTAYNGTQSSVTDHNVIPESVTSGQTYAWSPTIYYPVPQPASQTVGFTFHVTYRIICEDNKEVITVHDAKVHVPYTNTTWAAGNRYIYTFNITRDSKGSTNPGTTIDPQNPTPQTDKALFPIVFDGCTIEDFTEVPSSYDIN